jgi:DNA invertase Pin-like site-specific DNA recombinase
MGELIGYARVSSTSQDLRPQRTRLTTNGCTTVFEEQFTGTTANRPELAHMLRYIRKGDTLVITKLDRLARSVCDLGNIAKELQAKGVDLKVLDQPIDTTNPSGKLMFNMIGAFAEFERDLIRERCQEGIDRAKAAGKKFGRKPKLTKMQIGELRTEFELNNMSRSELATKYGISKASLYRLMSVTN